ncbi:MAG: phosphatase PAP2 family protein [Candidatus Marinimicrobia bacterium]|nr:phosphatase PAP2 family protein [Candidatus Neomarinimicrobiota bacterium]
MKSKRNAAGLLILCFLVCQPLFTRGQSLRSHAKSYPRYLINGAVEVVSDITSQVILGAAAVSVIALHRYDWAVRDYSQDNGLMANELSHRLDKYGGGWAYPALLLGVGLESMGRDDAAARVKYAFTSLAVTGLSTDLIKRASARHRPDGSDARSFPSGHTSGSFAVAAVVDELYGHWLGYPAYVVAALVGAHRIHADKHWLTDVIAGAALGTVIGRGFSIVYREEAVNDQIGVVPWATNRTVSFRIIIPIN